MRNVEDISETTIGVLEGVLEIPNPKWMEMRSQCSSQCSSEAEYHYQLMEYYLKSHEHPGWNHLAGQLLCWKQHRALDKVKENVTADKGKCVVDDTY